MTSKARRDRIVYLRQLANEGASQADAARETGMSPETIYTDAKEFGIEFANGRKNNRVRGIGRGPKYLDIPCRNACIARYGKMTAKEAAVQLGITRGRVIGHWFRARQQGLIT